ncbi:MAG: cobalt-precorrin-5B (C(1))-methyltransferase CbiD [Omnitrophica bacterium]|nr:cobalt-precorrin-5B (C(1))-methyltransferase CbiD [Candidatus Omnitrophota bacterium]
MSKIKNAFRNGFTTGTCAQAAAKGAGFMLRTQKLLKRVKVETPSGVKLLLKLIDQKIEKESAFCGIVKDAGDDPDITNGVKIYAKVKFSHQKGVSIKGGEGVGMVTKPGLAVDVGEYAINPTPRKMIAKEMSRYLPEDRGLEVVISAPRGEGLAKRTFNPRLGVVGGISIIGTTGIVLPKSTEAYKASLSLQLDVLKASGVKRAVLVLGYVGEKFAKEALRLQGDSIIKIGDHVGFMLKACAKKKIKDILLVGHIGKLVKVACGQFNTHSKFGDNRIRTIAHYAKTYKAKRSVIEELLKQATSEATIDILRKNRLMGVFGKIAQKVVITINEFLDTELMVRCILLSLKGEILGAYPKENGYE